MELIEKYFPSLTPRQREQFEALPALYKEWNARINVVSRKDIDEIGQRHILHSLAIARTGLIVPGESVLDIGCGGGFPGIPLAIFYPDVQFTMIDSIGKKIRVVEEIAKAVGLANVTPINGRCEEVAGRYDWVVSRAVAELRMLVGWAWNKTIRGMICLKGGDLGDEIRSANRRTEEYPISDWFAEPFFETKKVLVLSKK